MTDPLLVGERLHGESATGTLLLDLNGTVAQCGVVSDACAERLAALVDRGWAIEVLTGNTYGSLPVGLADLDGVEVVVVPDGAAKRARVDRAPQRPVVAVGNGVIDVPMMEAADLALGIFGPEGASPAALLAADLVFPLVDDALRALLDPAQLIAGLRR